ncbi:MAG: MBL fold metallo-hydrolase [Clostridiales bacterium]|nr:MBL fold metallo-hydrolase [Clostridiales bacterium]
MMKAIVVVDNMKGMGIPGEWGLCIYIEYKDQKILLDTGASKLFQQNSNALHIDLNEINYAVLSHAHYDHANGMETFFQENDHAKFYVQETTADNCYFKWAFIRKYIGIPKKIMEKYKDRFVIAKGKQKISEGIYLIPHSTPNLDLIGKRERMYQKKATGWFPDNFSHEQSLVFQTDKGMVIFNCCSHGGAVNIINEVQAAFPNQKVYALIGGFHIYNKPEKEIRELAKKIKETGISYVCTGHCSGAKGYQVLHEELGDMVQQLKVGLELQF